MLSSSIMKQLKIAWPYLKFGMILLLITVNLRSAIQYIAQVEQLGGKERDVIGEWEQYFDPIKAGLPFKHGTVGYAANWSVPGVDYSPADAEAEHILTQYAMAPIVVARDTDREWIIANMKPKVFEAWLALQPGKYEFTRYKHDLYLVHRLK